MVDKCPEVSVLGGINIEEQREGAKVAVAPLCQLSCVIQSDLHLQVKCFAVDRMLRRIVESNLEHLPVELAIAWERFCGVECTEIAVSRIDTEHIVREAVFVWGNSRDLPCRQ